MTGELQGDGDRVFDFVSAHAVAGHGALLPVPGNVEVGAGLAGEPRAADSDDLAQLSTVDEFARGGDSRVVTPVMADEDAPAESPSRHHR